MEEIPGLAKTDIIESIKKALEIVKTHKKNTPPDLDTSKVIINIDGASKGNPGEAGIGVVFQNDKDDVLKEFYKYIGKTTNNFAEYTALCYALDEAIKNNYKNIEIKSDSELIVKQLNGEYSVKSEDLKFLFLKAKEKLNKFDNYKIKHIPRAENKRADRLANIAISSEAKIAETNNSFEKENVLQLKKPPVNTIEIFNKKRNRIDISKVD
ncbi:ribonuclease HI family protein [Candidatus Desantisbacteria bacterium]|nr:ribonuclease HI family protein [Candidatus Desantisbacteria bacterium]